MIEAVIFDYGGVISSPLFRGVGKFESDMGYPAGAVLELLFGDRSYIGVEGTTNPVPIEVAVADAVTHDWHRLEIGELSLEGWFAGVQKRAPEVLGQEIDMGAYLEFMSNMPLGTHWPVVHKARELKEVGMPIALLTNNVKEWGNHWRATFPVDELFQVIVDSSEVGMRKPDPRIYLLTCERVGAAPENCVFIDDNADNIAAARALGMKTVHFGDNPFVGMSELDAILGDLGTFRAL